MILALFYVNDTLTPELHPVLSEAYRRRLRTPARAASLLRAFLRRQARHAAEQALSRAKHAQHLIWKEHGQFVPIVQYTHTDECWRTEWLLARQAEMAKAVAKAAAPSHTDMPKAQQKPLKPPRGGPTMASAQRIFKAATFVS